MSMKMNTLLVAVGAAVLGCAFANQPVTDAPPVSATPVDTTPVDSPIGMEDAKKLAQSNSLFAINLTKAISESQRGNWTLSPFSIATALQMVYEGSAGQTMSQIGKTLHLPAGSDGTVPGIGSLLQVMNRAGKGFTLNTANGAFAQEGYRFLPEYISRLNQYFGAEVTNVDFSDEPTALRIINGFVDQKTQGMIPEIIDSTSADLRMVLVNAIYLNADWASPFDSGATIDLPFNIENGEKKSVPTMNKAERIDYFKGPNFQSVTLPYVQQGDSKFAMVVMLPNEGTSVGDMVSSLTVDQWLGTGSQPREVELFLPKFKIEWGEELNPVLRSLGMNDAFVPNVADLSRMDGTRDLFVSFVKHKAVVQVDEKGTEAAAATAVGIRATSIPMDQVMMKFDRPFAFSIVDQQTGLILFTGVVRQP